MANYEQIKKFALIKKGFSIETGELTNTLKIRSAVVMQKYKSIIDEMYVQWHVLGGFLIFVFENYAVQQKIAIFAMKFIS